MSISKLPVTGPRPTPALGPIILSVACAVLSPGCACSTGASGGHPGASRDLQFVVQSLPAHAIGVSSPDSCYIVAGTGDLLLTFDGGDKWKTVSRNLYGPFRAV